MTRGTRLLLALAALLLAALYVTPMWRIDLQAPQYPEGLGLRIWIDRIEGAGPNDLQSINGLNHYIGMKAITPADIPELRLMPWVVAALIAGGLVVALGGARRLLYAYALAFVGIALAGMYDFWRWEHDYGHNLDPTAAIRIPGMSYQPPLIGGKQLLNFHASSWPDIGGALAMLSAAIVVLLAVREFRRARAAHDALPGLAPAGRPA